jgi:hypothetical protein
VTERSSDSGKSVGSGVGGSGVDSGKSVGCGVGGSGVGIVRCITFIKGVCLKSNAEFGELAIGEIVFSKKPTP